MKRNSNTAVIYARVSSTGERQSTARQVADLTRYAEASGMEVVAVYEEKASGAKRDREQLAACRAFLLGGGAQHLLVTELSRLGRSLKQVLEVVDELTAAGVNIYFQAQGLNTIVDGKPDATVKAMVSMFGAFAEPERSTIVDRLQSGRRVALEKGTFTPGRPAGSKMSDEDLLAKYPKAVKRLQAGRTIREVAGECGLSTKTVQRIKNVMVPRYLNEFHKRNSQACREALRSSSRQPLSVEDVLEQSRRTGRTTARAISSAKDLFKKR